MEEKHQNATNDSQVTIENKIWLPPSFTNDKASIASEQTPTKKKTSSKWGFSEKTGWDWLNLVGILLIPLMIGVFTVANNMQQNQISQQQYNNNQMIALDQQRETTLKTYLDDMKDLLLNHGLGSYNSADAVRQVARVETLTTLERLDPHRKMILLNFLFQANLITVIIKTRSEVLGNPLDKEITPIINLDQANLSTADLSSINLENTTLEGMTTVQDCDDYVSTLEKEVMKDPILTFGAVVKAISLEKTNLNNAQMHNAQLNYADFTGASFEKADLQFAQLSCASLANSDLRGANLSYANLGGTIFDGADLSGAKLFHAEVNLEYLTQAASLHGTIMPDGSIHP